MLDELKFVQGAVSKKNFLPALTHFRIEAGNIRSFNGTLALSSPIKLDIDCTPKADPFIKAIQKCTETVSMSLTKAGRLRIQSGTFKVFINCTEEETHHVEPEGELHDIDGEVFLKAIKTIAPFIGIDASRPWSNGILLKGQSAYATNNVSLVEYWVGNSFPVICNIPKSAIVEIIRINKPPTKVQISNKSISFLYEDDKWIRTSLLDICWPDLDKILNTPSNPVPIDERIFEGLESIKPFVDKLGRVYIQNETICTSIIEGEGATYEIPDFKSEGAYQLGILNLLKNTATKIDFSTYPKPCLFFGERLRGAIIGMRT